MNKPVSLRAKIACIQAALCLPDFLPCTVLHLAVQANYSEPHFRDVLSELEDDGVFTRSGSGGRGGYEFALDRERCREVYGDYVDLGEPV